MKFPKFLPTNINEIDIYIQTIVKINAHNSTRQGHEKVSMKSKQTVTKCK